ncbi:unnamed protein product [Closterium sp. NIES-54]
MAYFVNWANMDPSLIPAAKLTHVFYAFASINPTTYKVATALRRAVLPCALFSVPSAAAPGLPIPFAALALSLPNIPSLLSLLSQVVPNTAVDVTGGLYQRFNTTLKTANPTIKTLLSIGGASANTTVFSNAASSAATRSAFIQSAIALTRTYFFDGLDIDWEYPIGKAALFSALVTDFRAAIESEAASSGKPKLLLTAAVAPDEARIIQSYNVTTTNKMLDFVNIMTYDLHGSWEAKTGMHFPSAGPELEAERQCFHGCLGVSRLGPKQGHCRLGDDAGILFYKEIDQLVTTGGYTATSHTPSSCMYAWNDNHPSNSPLIPTAVPASQQASPTSSQHSHQQISLNLSPCRDTTTSGTSGHSDAANQRFLSALFDLSAFSAANRVHARIAPIAFALLLAVAVILVVQWPLEASPEFIRVIGGTGVDSPSYYSEGPISLGALDRPSRKASVSSQGFAALIVPSPSSSRGHAVNLKLALLDGSALTRNSLVPGPLDGSVRNSLVSEPLDLDSSDGHAEQMRPLESQTSQRLGPEKKARNDAEPKATAKISSLDDPLVIQQLDVGHKVNLSCRIKEARYLNRTLVLDMRVCLNQVHNNGKFVYKAIYEHIDLSSIEVPFTPLQGFLEEAQAWRRERAAGEAPFGVRVVKRTASTATVALDTVTPLIIRKTSYGYSTCKLPGTPFKHDDQGVAFRPELLALAAAMSQSMHGGDYDAVHVRRGDKVNPRLWPHLDNDTQAASLLEKLPKFVEPGRTLYIATNEHAPGFFDPLKRLYDIRLWQDFKHLWVPGTMWYDGYEKISGAHPTMDTYMEVIVEYSVMTLAKHVAETFNDLTSDDASGARS